MPIRYRRAMLARQLRAFHPGHHEFIRERLRAFDAHNGHDKMIPVVAHRKLKSSPHRRDSVGVSYQRAPIISG
jgi:hypothetical protein